MRRLQVGLGLALVLLMAGVVLAQKVDRDYDHKAPWKSYRTFMWVRQPEMEDPALNEQVMSLVSGQLQTKGWQMVQDNADVGLIANGSTEARHTVESFYDGFPGWGWHRWGGPGVVTTEVETYTAGTLVVDMFDARTKQLVWRGYAEASVSKNPAKNAQKLDKAVDKLFDNFPPK